MAREQPGGQISHLQILQVSPQDATQPCPTQYTCTRRPGIDTHILFMVTCLFQSLLAAVDQGNTSYSHIPVVLMLLPIPSSKKLSS